MTLQQSDRDMIRVQERRRRRQLVSLWTRQNNVFKSKIVMHEVMSFKMGKNLQDIKDNVSGHLLAKETT